MRFAGVDYSMTSPAVCVFEGDDEFDFSGCRIYYYTDKAKYAVQKLGFQLRGHLARAPIRGHAGQQAERRLPLVQVEKRSRNRRHPLPGEAEP